MSVNLCYISFIIKPHYYILELFTQVNYVFLNILRYSYVEASSKEPV